MIHLTKSQRAAVCMIFHRSQLRTSYRAFRRTVQPGPGCIMVPFAGMWLGVEPDGHTHS